jgi:hypothetical protein
MYMILQAFYTSYLGGSGGTFYFCTAGGWCPGNPMLHSRLGVEDERLSQERTLS